MKKNMIITMLLLSSLSLWATPPKGVESLSSDLRGLLTSEMLAVEKGMKSIFTDIISGNYYG